MGAATRPTSKGRWCAQSEVSGITRSGCLQFTRPTGDGHDRTTRVPEHLNSIRISLEMSRGTFEALLEYTGLPAVRFHDLR
jgi:hypothetical protein